MGSNDISSVSDELVLSAPSRQPLYHVVPQSIDGRFRECMSSYFGNLASEHGTSPAILLNNVISVAAAEYRDDRRSSFAVKSFPQRIDGTTEYAVGFSEMLSRLTGVDNLNRHVLKAFSKITSHRGFLRDKLAWCPQFLDSVTKPYIPILWRLAWVKVCPKFRVPLHVSCSSCGKPVHVLCGRGNVGYCTHYQCQADLSRSFSQGCETTALGQIKDMRYEIWVAEQTEDLIEALRLGELQEDFSWSAVIRFWLDHFALTGKRGVAQRVFEINPSSLGLWVRGEQQPTMQHLFNFAWVLGVDVLSFLGKKVPDNHDGSLRPSLMYKSKDKTAPKRPIDRPKILRRLRSIIDDDLYPYEPFSRIAKRIGRGQAVLRQTFPEEAKYLGQRFMENRKIKARLRRAADRAELIEACQVIAEMNEVISARRVRALVSKPSLVVDPKFGAALIQDMRRRQIEGQSQEITAN